jgi:hypothetical protein
MAPSCPGYGDTTLAFVAGPDRVVMRTSIRLKAADRTQKAKFRVEAGQTIPFVLTYNASFEDMPFAIDPRHVADHSDHEPVIDGQALERLHLRP